MYPSMEQIAKAAYDRWERRGRFHGRDREDWIAAEADLTFDLNYRTIAEYGLGGTNRQILGNPRKPRCRFCEQSPPRAAFSAQRAVVPEEAGNTSLYTAEICDECAEQFEEATGSAFLRFWNDLETIRDGAASCSDLRAPGSITIAAYKATVRMALSIMPEAELAGCTDTIEWVGNPDHEFDSSLFGGVGCLAYRTHVPFGEGWVSLAKRTDDEVSLPFLVFFLASSRLVLQVHVPLCTRDEDLDGSEVRMPERSFSTGQGPDLRPSTRLVLPLRSADAAKPRRFRLFW